MPVGDGQLPQARTSPRSLHGAPDSALGARPPSTRDSREPRRVLPIEEWVVLIADRADQSDQCGSASTTPPAVVADTTRRLWAGAERSRRRPSRRRSGTELSLPRALCSTGSSHVTRERHPRVIRCSFRFGLFGPACVASTLPVMPVELIQLGDAPGRACGDRVIMCRRCRRASRSRAFTGAPKAERAFDAADLQRGLSVR